MNFEWLESKTYTDDLESICKSISKDATLAQTEAQTADAFQRQLYYHIRLKTGVEINFNQEQPISGGLIHEFGSLKKRSSGKGRLDAVVNDLIIEYKKHSKLKNKKDQEIARNQVKDYLNAMFINEKIKYNAILTDGVKISYFEFIGDHVESTAFKYLEAEDIDRIIKAILTHENKKMIPENILRDFAILDQNVQSITKELAISLYHTLTNCPTEKTNMLYCEWERLMHLSFDDHGKGNDINKRREDLARILDTDNIFDSDKEYKALFTLQTTYSIIVKLIACRAIEKLEYSEIKNYSDLTTLNNLGLQQFFEKLEDGYVHRIMNIGNLLEGDFFSWYSEKEQWEKNPDISKCIKKIIIRVDEYSTFSLGLDLKTFDIFKDLYMSIIPKTVRHSMGEYFTPGWLANYVVSEGLQLQENKNWKALDPCCGSGTFIIALINKIIENNKPKNADDSYILSEEQKARIKEKILDSVYGIDINPLSVLSARVSYYLVLRQLGEVENVEIPIYLGDSAITPTQEIIDGIPCYSYYIENAKKPFHVVLPVRFVKLKEFGQIMTTLQNAVRIGNEETLLLTIADYLTDNEKNAKKLMKSIKLMVKDLIELHRSNWDGIWIRIATNFMYIARLDKFDFIVGNPPWVKWEHLPSTYASKIKKLCNIRHIFTTKGQFGGTQLNICALIANVSATNWLKDSGVLAFLMPDSIMSQDSYEEFRHFYLDYENNERLYLQKIDKWEKPLKPFTCENIVVSQDFNTYYYTKKETDYKKGINVRTISRTKAITDLELNKNKLFESVKEYLIFGNKLAAQMSEKTSAFSYLSNEYDFHKIIGDSAYEYRTGVEFTPQELYMLVGKGDSTKEGYYRFDNKKFGRSKHRIEYKPSKGWELPTEYIYPIVTGPSLTPFHSKRKNEFCILPYTVDKTDEPINISEMRRTNLDLFRYLLDHQHLIEQQSEKSKMMHRGKEFYALSKIGPYTFAEYIVAARDNTRFCAAVIEPTRTPWNETKSSICVKHTIIIGRTNNGRFITKDEAHYIAGILNSDIVIQYIQNTFKSNGYSLKKSHFYIPEYDKSDPRHIKISIIAQKAAKLDDDSRIKKIQRELSNLYLEVCDTK